MYLSSFNKFHTVFHYINIILIILSIYYKNNIFIEIFYKWIFYLIIHWILLDDRCIFNFTKYYFTNNNKYIKRKNPNKSIIIYITILILFNYYLFKKIRLETIILIFIYLLFTKYCIFKNNIFLKILLSIYFLYSNINYDINKLLLFIFGIFLIKINELNRNII